MLKSIVDLIRKPKPTSEELRAALAALSTAPSEARLVELEAERRRLVLDGTEEQLSAVEREIAATCREIERVGIASEELTRRVAEAEAREAFDQLTAERNAAETEAETVAGLLRTRYPKLAAELVGLLERLQAAESGVSKTNERLVEGGREGERLQGVEVRVIPATPHVSPSSTSLLTRTSLKQFTNGFAASWNDAWAILGG